MRSFFSRKKTSCGRPAHLGLELLEDRTVPTTFVVGSGGSASLQHFNTLGAALGSAQTGDTIQIAEQGVQTDASFVNSSLAGKATNGSTAITTKARFTPGSIITISTGVNQMRTVVDATTPAAGGLFNLTLHNAVFNAPAGGYVAGTTVMSSGQIGIDKAINLVGLPVTTPFVSVPSSFGGGLDVWVGTNGVTFQDLNLNATIEDPSTNPNDPAGVAVASATTFNHVALSSLIIPTQSGQNVVTNSSLFGLTETGGGTGTANGANSITFNQFSGSVSLTGNAAGTATNDVFSNNIFQNTGGYGNGLTLQNFGSSTTTLAALSVTNDDGATVSNNAIYLNGDATGIAVLNSQNATVNGNVIRDTGLTTFNARGITVSQTGTAQVSGTLSSNDVSTFNGQGIVLSMADGTKFTQTVNNNDLRNNALGVGVSGDQTAATTAAGSVTLSGNNFDSFTAADAAANARSSISLSGAANGTVTATGNIFNDANPAGTVRDGAHNTTAGGNFTAATGTVNVDSPLAKDAAYIQGLYLEFLGRSATSSEMSYWSPILSASGHSAVATGIVHSQEYFTRLVTNCYVNLLDRQPDADGLTYWVNQLNAGATEESVLAGFLSSAEYYNLPETRFRLAVSTTMTPNQAWVQTLYTVMLGRNASATEVNYWMGQIDTLGLNGAANAFLQSSEFRQHQVVSDYNVASPTPLYGPPLHLLNRTTGPSPSELTFWATPAGNDLLTIQVGIASSNENG